MGIRMTPSAPVVASDAARGTSFSNSFHHSSPPPKSSSYAITPTSLSVPAPVPTSANKASPPSAITMSAADSHYQQTRNFNINMSELMQPHSSGATFSDLQSNLTEDSVARFGERKYLLFLNYPSEIINTSKAGEDSEDNIYLRGIRKLGLSSAVKNEGTLMWDACRVKLTGLLLGLGAVLLQDFTQSSPYQASSAPSSSTEDLKTSRRSGSGVTGLEALDYYAVELDNRESPLMRQKGKGRQLFPEQPLDAAGGRSIGGNFNESRSNSGRKKYSWEEEDFGLSEERVS